MDNYLILTLAAWRITSLVVYEDGPFAIFEKLRTFAGVEQTDYGPVGIDVLGKLFACSWCMSMWTAALVIVIGLYLPAWVLLPFAVSSGVILFDETIGRLKR